MSAFPLPPSLSRVLLFAADQAEGEVMAAVLTVVAMLSVEVLFVRPADKQRMAAADRAHAVLQACGGDDFGTLLYIHNCFSTSPRPREWARRFHLHVRALQTAQQIRTQLALVLENERKRLGLAPLRLSEGGGTSEREQHGEPRAKRPRLDHLLLTEEMRQELVDSDMPGPVPLETRERVAQALCYGFFNNVARRSAGSAGFRVMDGHASSVLVHPSSALHGQQDGLDWVIFHEVVWTSKPYMRTLCPIRYAWVKDLLPKLHEVDLSALSGTGRVLETAGSSASGGHAAGRLSTAEADAAAAAEAARRTDDAAVAAARERYLARRQARGGGKAGK